MTRIVRVALAAALLSGLGATAASAEPDPPGPYPCKLRMEPWIATDIGAVPYVGRPYFDCYY